MNTAAQIMEFIREVFQAAKVFCAAESDLEKIVAYCENTDSEFRSIAYEAASMQIGLRDFAASNQLQNWKHFADELAKPHAAQIYAGLGWAVAQEVLESEHITEDFPPLLRYRVADGCGYYDGTFRNRQTVRMKAVPTYISEKALPAYYQGLGRSLWYISKGDAVKTNELLLGFPTTRHGAIWRGVGIAVAYVGGCDEATLNELKTFSGNFLRQLKCGVALAARSRVQAGSLTEDAELCSRIVCNCSAAEATQLTVDAEGGDYFQWVNSIENAFL
jgi:hypothetical protein